MKTSLALAAAAVIAAGAAAVCSRHVIVPEACGRQEASSADISLGRRLDGRAAVPHAVVYRMSGPYADNVPVTLNDAGTELLSYPAPTDLTDQSMPLALSDGWWLDRRGVAPTSVFTSYTYADYRAMPAAPTPAELLARVIPGARVVELRRLPLLLTEALDNPALADSLIAAGAAN